MPLVWVIVHFIAAGLLAALVNHLGLRAWRRAEAAHWTERARLLWPVRYTAGINLFMLPGFLVALHVSWDLQPTPELIAEGVAGLLGSLLGCYPMEREIFPGYNFAGWSRQVVAGGGLRFGGLLAFFAALIFMPARVGWGVALVAAGYLIFHGLIQWGLFRQLLRLARMLKPAGPRLQEIVADGAARMGVRVRSTWELGGMTANALALPVTRELIFTERLLAICNDEEVAAICTHELAHLTESKAVLAGRLLRSFSFFPLIFVNPAVQYWGLPGLLVLYAAMLLILAATRRLPQAMEKRADAAAVREQTNEGVYARALEKLYQANQTPAVSGRNKHAAHPHLYDRMTAAGVTPDYPRPARPRKLTGAGWALVFGWAALLVASWVLAIVFALRGANPDGP